MVIRIIYVIVTLREYAPRSTYHLKGLYICQSDSACGDMALRISSILDMVGDVNPGSWANNAARRIRIY